MRSSFLLACVVVATLLAGCAGDTSATASCPGGDETPVCEVFRLVNVERRGAGVEPYAWNRELALAAQLHAEDMVAEGYFSHVSLDGRSFSDRAVEAGYDASPRGENIAAGQRSAEQVMSSWMASEGHRANILAEGSTEIGVGLEGAHWVQVFGRRVAPEP